MSRGERFREAVTAGFEDPDPDAEVLLGSLSRTLDELEAMEAAIADDGLTVDGSRGQPVAHPLLAQVVRHRDLVARLARELFPNEREETATELARRAARARWGRR